LDKDHIKRLLTGYIRRDGGVSFAELRCWLERDGVQFTGDANTALELRPNLVLWMGLPAEVADAVIEMVRAGQITVRPTSVLVYVAGSRLLTLPVAKRIQPYKKPHWLPVCLYPPAEEAQPGN
jgi:hypothetical protein